MQKAASIGFSFLRGRQNVKTRYVHPTQQSFLSNIQTFRNRYEPEVIY